MKKYQTLHMCLKKKLSNYYVNMFWLFDLLIVVIPFQFTEKFVSSNRFKINFLTK